MKIAIVADSHFDEHSRFEECCSLHSWIEADATGRGCELMLHAGDLFERRSTPRERVMVAEWICDVAQSMPVIVVRGNHDQLEEHDLLPSLRSRHPIRVHDATGIDVVAGVAVASLAWPRKAFLDASGLGSGDAMRSVLRGLGDQLAQHDGPRVLLAHAMVRGSRTSTGQELIGCELELGLEDLALARADLYALGHIHRHQNWDVAGAPAIYPGSPRRANFGELEPKGYVVAEFDGRSLVGWEFVETPATRMLHLEAEWFCDHIGLPGDVVVPAGLTEDWKREDVAGAEVRLRYRVEADHRDAARRAAQEVADALRARGAVTIKVEEQVIATTRARAPEVARAVTTLAKLEALWTSRGERLDPARAEALASKLWIIEGQGEAEQ